MKELEDMSPAELDELMKSASKAKAEAEKKHRKQCKADVEKVLAEYGYSIDELYPRLGDGSKSKSKSKGEAKFKNPETGEIWTGQGRRPSWLVEAEKAGRSREEFRV